MMVELFRVEHDFHVSACAAGQLWDKVHTSSETAIREAQELRMELQPYTKWLLDPRVSRARIRARISRRQCRCRRSGTHPTRISTRVLKWAINLHSQCASAIRRRL